MMKCQDLLISSKTQIPTRRSIYNKQSLKYKNWTSKQTAHKKN